jgi:hypothetical protein
MDVVFPCPIVSENESAQKQTADQVLGHAVRQFHAACKLIEDQP